MKQILIKPIITEKTLKSVNELNKYTFLVNNKANKIEIAKEVATKFSVKVTGVKIVNVLGKDVKFGKSRESGTRSNYKKAIVTLKKGDKITVFDIK